MNHFTAIVDYGVGNLRSVEKAMAYLGMETRITSDPGELELASAIILPGVGAFPDAMARLKEPGLDRVLITQAEKKPLLGICLGMQLLFDQSLEGRPTQGLGLIPGSVERIVTAEKLPHIGWNELSLHGESPLFRGLNQGDYVYFVHTYAAVGTPKSYVIGTTDYGTDVVAAVARGNVYGCQFHPEKSGETGLQILKNFGELSK